MGQLLLDVGDGDSDLLAVGFGRPHPVEVEEVGDPAVEARGGSQIRLALDRDHGRHAQRSCIGQTVEHPVELGEEPDVRAVDDEVQAGARGIRSGLGFVQKAVELRP
jgi:hypothetical protein